jgi:hypothetical protein
MLITSNKDTQISIITRLVVASEVEGNTLAEAMYKASGRPATVERHDNMFGGKWFIQFYSDQIETVG